MYDELRGFVRGILDGYRYISEQNSDFVWAFLSLIINLLRAFEGKLYIDDTPV